MDGQRIDPLLMLARAEALLTGRAFGESDDTRPLQIAATEDGRGGCRIVERLSDSLVTALASASIERLAEVAVPWSQTEEFRGHGDPEALAGFLELLAELAQLAQGSGQRLYCWSSV